jgi:hypothetical protein
VVSVTALRCTHAGSFAYVYAWLLFQWVTVLMVFHVDQIVTFWATNEDA